MASFLYDNTHLVGQVIMHWASIANPAVKRAREQVIQLLDFYDGKINQQQLGSTTFTLAQDVSWEVEYIRSKFFNVIEYVQAHLGGPLRRRDILKRSRSLVKKVDDVLEHVRLFLNAKILDEDDDDPVTSPSFTFKEVKEMLYDISVEIGNFYMWGGIYENSDPV
jgi:hypothetical protein